MKKKSLNLKKAIKRPGAFTAWCKSHGFDGVTKSCIAEAKRIAKKRKDKTLMGEANLADRIKYGDLAKARKK